MQGRSRTVIEAGAAVVRFTVNSRSFSRLSQLCLPGRDWRHPVVVTCGSAEVLSQHPPQFTTCSGLPSGRFTPIMAA
jgi:hypothetical protein